MSNRWVVVGLVLAVVTGAAVVALVQQQRDTVQLSPSPEAADQVTVYQSGLVFVELSRTFQAPGGETVLELSVPRSTLVDSLRLSGEGVSVKEVRAAPSIDPTFETGDELVVTTESGTFEGTLVEQRSDGWLLDTGDGSATLVRNDAIEAIELVNWTQQAKPADAVDVEVLVDARAGNRTVEVAYLATGPRWVPSYQLDVDTGRFTFFATLRGVASWSNVTLDLVSGSPNIVAQPSQGGFDDVRRGLAAADGEAGASSYDVGVEPVGTLGSLHRYRLDRPVDLVEGQTMRLPVLDGSIQIVEHYHEARQSIGWGSLGDERDTQVLERYELANNLTEPLPPGVVRFFEQGTWIGEDVLEQTPVGAHANVTVAEAFEVEAETTLTEQTATSERTESTYALTVTDHRGEISATAPTALRAVLDAPDFRTTILETTPTADEVTGTTARWFTDLGPGEETTFELTFEQRQR